MFRSSRIHKPSDREMAKTYDYYIELYNRVPDYLIKKLSGLPNNKGYIWKGLHLYGCLEADDHNTTTMFEKIGRDVTRIHVWDDKKYRIFTKEGNSPKTLLQEKSRSIQNAT